MYMYTTLLNSSSENGIWWNVQPLIKECFYVISIIIMFPFGQHICYVDTCTCNCSC